MNTDEYPLVNEHSYVKWHLKHHDHHDNQSIIQRATFNFSLDFAPGDLALVDHVDGSARRRGRECLQPSAMSVDGFGFEG